MSGLRDATVADLDALADLESTTFPGRPWTRADLAGELGRTGAIAVVAGDDASLDGAALGWSAGGVSELTRISVGPQCRRLGLGRRLLVAFEQRAEAGGAEEAWLEVRADNIAAIGLYRRAGYSETGRRTRYYTDGCDAVLMGRRLGDVRSSG